MAKRVPRPPGWIGAPQVTDIYSVSDCVTDNFADYISHWKHNDQWHFDSPEAIESLSIEISASLEGCILFYYEAYEMEFANKSWNQWRPESPASGNLVPPVSKKLEGFDVVTFYAGTSPEHSPLSCNSMADDIPTNSHCLFDSFVEAEERLEDGTFCEAEPGPCRIYAVYTVDWPHSEQTVAALE